MADPSHKPEPIPPDLLAFVDPSETSLLEYLRTKVSRLMLEELSRNDYGEEASDHLAGIENQMNGGADPTPLYWCPGEVLALERWQEPAPSSEINQESFQREHLKRLLACTILLRSAGYQSPATPHPEGEHFLDTSATTLVQLTRSTFALQGGLEKPALALVLWLYESQPYPLLQPFAAFCALLLMATLPAQPEANIATTLAWVDAVEARCRAEIGSEASDSWLIGLNSYEGNTKDRRRWQDATQTALKHAQNNGNPSAVRVLNSVLHRLDRF